MHYAIDHTLRGRKAYRLLRKCAKQGRFITYGELAAAQGLHHRSARWFLGVIQEFMREQGLPPLQALCVRKDTRKPGAGYAGSPTRGRRYEKAVREVFRHPWPKNCPF